MNTRDSAANERTPTDSRDLISKTHHILNGNLSLNDLDKYLSDVRQPPKLSAHLMQLLAERDISYEDFGMLANIGRSTVYKIMNGKQLPEQDMLLRMAFVLELSGQETQQLLKAGHRAQLTSSRPRDVAIIIGLQNGLTLDEMDEVLLQRDLAPLTPVEKKLSEFLLPLAKGLSLGQLLVRAHLDSAGFAAMHGLSGESIEALDAVLSDLEKDDLLKIGFALGLSPSEVQRMLRIAHRAFLNAKDERDSLILDGLAKGTSIEEINAALTARHAAPLF